MSSNLADDLLHGAAAIAHYVFKKKDRKHKRKVYYEYEMERWPIWKDGDGVELISRKSLLNAHFNPPSKIEAAE
jgi:hypothetical protein